MDWNTLFEQWSATWAGFGAIGLLVVKSLLDAIGNRKVRLDLSSYQSLYASGKVEMEAFTKLIVNAVADIKESIIQPMIVEMKQKDYQQAVFMDVVISLMSSVNVPLQNKEEAFRRLSTLDGMNKEIINKIMLSIEAQKQQAISAQQVQTQVYEDLDKGV